eukprot:13603516-Alexandrium_andersonii.AAC.1
MHPLFTELLSPLEMLQWPLGLRASRGSRLVPRCTGHVLLWSRIAWFGSLLFSGLRLIRQLSRGHLQSREFSLPNSQTGTFDAPQCPEEAAVARHPSPSTRGFHRS